MNLVFKIMPASSTFHGVDYSEKKKEQGVGSLIHYENLGYLQERSQFSKGDIKEFLKRHSAGNNRVKKPQFHAVLSCEGSKVTHEQLKEEALKIMNKLGYHGQPILIYEHRDTKNNHVHIVTSRVNSAGKKISDKFEGIRANKILNELLSIDEKKQCEQAIKEAAGFSITTASQFILLLEKQGYACKRQGEEVVLYKHGHRQGVVANGCISKQIGESRNRAVNTSQVKAIIQKYKGLHSSDLIANPVSGKQNAKRVFSSHLTDYLHKKLGLEFVFFNSKAHNMPYGYVIIDHKNKAVIKGSEVMKLGQLTGKVVAQGRQQGRQGDKSSTADKVSLPGNRPVNLVDRTTDSGRTQRNEGRGVVPSFMDESLMQSLELIMEDALRENEGSGLPIKRKKSKRKNQSY